MTQLIEKVKEVPFEIQLEEAKLHVDAYELLVQGLEIEETLSIGKIGYELVKGALDAHRGMLNERRDTLATLYAEADKKLTEKNKDA